MKIVISDTLNVTEADVDAAGVRLRFFGNKKWNDRFCIDFHKNSNRESYFLLKAAELGGFDCAPCCADIHAVLTLGETWRTVLPLDEEKDVQWEGRPLSTRGWVLPFIPLPCRQSFRVDVRLLNGVQKHVTRLTMSLTWLVEDTVYIGEKG